MKNKKDLKKAEKRKMELERRKKQTRTIMIVTIMAIVIISSFAYFLVISGSNTNENSGSAQESPISSEDDILIPVSGITDDAQFYTYDSNGVTIKYFTVRGPDGEIHVALDACDVCYGAKKGYSQVGDVMHCINCGKEFAINSIGTDNTAGGCWPSYLSISIEDDNIILQISDLEAKRYMFA